MGGKMCEKKDTFGTTKTYDHRDKLRWTHALTPSEYPPIRNFTHGLENHTLGTFE